MRLKQGCKLRPEGVLFNIYLHIYLKLIFSILLGFYLTFFYVTSHPLRRIKKWPNRRTARLKRFHRLWTESYFLEGSYRFIITVCKVYPESTRTSLPKTLWSQLMFLAVVTLGHFYCSCSMRSFYEIDAPFY